MCDAMERADDAVLRATTPEALDAAYRSQTHAKRLFGREALQLDKARRPGFYASR